MITAKRSLVCLAILFAVTRLGAYAWLGLKFDADTLTWFWQFADPELLKTRLIETVFYLHSQPPAFNLFLGICLKLGAGASAFHGIFLGIGFLLSVSLFLLMDRLGISPAISLALTGLFIVSPATLLYENWLFYTTPVALMLCASGIFLIGFVKYERAESGVCFFFTIVGLALTRSLFHPIWVFGCLIALWVMLPERRRSQWRTAAIPFAILLAVCLKSVIVFGQVSGSSWLGFSLSKLTTFGLPEQTRKDWIRSGRLSPAAQVPPFSPLSVYREHGIRFDSPPTGIPVLDRETKSTGQPNFGHRDYLALSRQYFKDSFVVLEEKPETYLKEITYAWYTFFVPFRRDRYPAWDENVHRLTKISALFEGIYYGRFRSFPAKSPTSSVRYFLRVVLSQGLFSIGLYFITLFWGASLIVQKLRTSASDRKTGVVLLFLWTTVLFVSVTGNALELGDNNRFRYTVEPFMLVFAGLFIQQVIQDVKNRFPRNHR